MTLHDPEIYNHVSTLLIWCILYYSVVLRYICLWWHVILICADKSKALQKGASQSGIYMNIPYIRHHRALPLLKSDNKCDDSPYLLMVFASRFRVDQFYSYKVRIVSLFIWLCLGICTCAGLVTWSSNVSRHADYNINEVRWGFMELELTSSEVKEKVDVKVLIWVE